MDDKDRQRASKDEQAGDQPAEKDASHLQPRIDDPFAVFCEWAEEADTHAFAKL